MQHCQPSALIVAIKTKYCEDEALKPLCAEEPSEKVPFEDADVDDEDYNCSLDPDEDEDEPVK